MSFSYDPAAPVNRDRLRFVLGDTDPDAYLFEDSELDMLLVMENNVLNVAASVACRSVATNSAKQAIVIKLLDITVDKKSIPKLYIELADKFLSMEENTIDEYIDTFAFVRDELGSDDQSEFIDNEEFGSI